MKSLFFAIPVSIALLAGSTWAADIETPVYDWTGAYVGLQAGAAWGDWDDTIEGDPSPWDDDLSGFVGGAHIGYNFMITDGFLLGLEADVEGTSIGADDSIPANNNDTEDEGIDLPVIGSVRARAGLAMDTVLLYVTGGLAAAAADFDSHDDDLGSGTEHGTFVGYTIGAGAEMVLSENLTARLEYRYTDLGSEKFNPEPFICEPVDCTFKDSVDFHAIRAAISYHF
jgi:outer membrane immunogenic protein